MTTLLATDSVAVGVTVIATLVIVALAGAVWYLLKTVRELRQEADGLAREAEELLDEMDLTVAPGRPRGRPGRPDGGERGGDQRRRRLGFASGWRGGDGAVHQGGGVRLRGGERPAARAWSPPGGGGRWHQGRP